MELGHGRPLAAQLHRRALAAGLHVGRASARASTPRSCRPTLEMDGLITQALGDHGQVRPARRRSRWSSTSGARGTRSCRARTPGFLAQQNSLRDALIAALNINIFARHADRVRMANIAQMVNVLQAMILTDKEKMVLTPTYHVFRMYVPFQDATFVPVTFDAGTLHARRHHAAARRRDRRQGRVRHAVARAHQRRSDAAGRDRRRR